MKTLPIFLTIFLFTCFISTAGNGQTTNVWGKVIDESTLKPLAGVNISLENNRLGLGTITNQKGEFRLWNLPHDTSNIVISFDGYQSSMVSINSLASSVNDIRVITLSEKNPDTDKNQLTNDRDRKIHFLKKKAQARK